MKFTKMQGCGNDYVYVNAFEEKIDDPEALSIRVSNRNFGIGSDGLILIKPSDKADFFMDMYNLDGSRGRMCGNGIRCVGKYVYDHGMTDKKKIDVETLSGIKHLELFTGADGKVEQVRVDMGAPLTDPESIPVKLEGKGPFIGHKLEIETEDGIKEERSFTFVSMGSPHAVTFVDDIESLPLEKIGPCYEFHDMFPQRANIEFVHVIDRSHIEFRVWERGSGETKACGTGACGSVVASILNGFTDSKVSARMIGGELTIEYDAAKNTVFMTGPAVTVFEGTID